MKNHKGVMVEYIDAFNAGSLERLLALFSADADVYSPTQPEPKKPRDFYPGLLERSKGVTFTLKSTFAGDRPDEAAMVFSYAKPVPDGSVNVFDCVDIFAFDAAGKIVKMWIIFDTKNLTKSA